MRSSSLLLPGALALAALSVLAQPAAASFNPTFSYRITGATTYQPGEEESADFQSTNFIVNFPVSGQSTGGNLGFGVDDPAIDIDRPELFSDPVFGPSAARYENLGNWGYFSVLTSSFGGDSLVLALKPPASGPVVFEDLFSTFLTSNPGWSYGRVRDAVLDGPDINGGSGNNPDYFLVAGYLNNAPFLGNIGTTFQSAETLTLYAFYDDEVRYLGESVGSLTVNAYVIPEPAALGLLAPAALLLKRRGR